MNITYIIGNGFDLRFGLPTSYADFAQYYAPELCKKGNETLCTKICQNIEASPRPRPNEMLMILFLASSYGNNWSDLESHLGKFTEKLDPSEFISFYPYLNSELDNYLQKVEQSCSYINLIEKNLFSKCLSNPLKFFKEEESIRRVYLNGGKLDAYANIITFNYTSTVKELSSSFQPQPNNDNWSSFSFSSNNIHHIHGTLNDGGILFGVDNSSQITNQAFLEDDQILDFIIKPQGNAEIGNKVDEECIRCINNTNVFCIFGTSLGETDSTWWQMIGRRFLLNESTIILLFVYAPEYKPKIKHEIIHIKRENKRKLLNALNLPLDKSLQDRIFVSINSEMFPKRKKMPIPIHKKTLHSQPLSLINRNSWAHLVD